MPGVGSGPLELEEQSRARRPEPSSQQSSLLRAVAIAAATPASQPAMQVAEKPREPTRRKRVRAAAISSCSANPCRGRNSECKKRQTQGRKEVPAYAGGVEITLRMEICEICERMRRRRRNGDQS